MNTIFSDKDFSYMQRAIDEANKTGDFDEVPVGAVVTIEDTILAVAGKQSDIIR